MINSKKIKARMVEMDLHNKDVAEAMGCAPSTASQKITGYRPMSITEASALASLLKLSKVEYYEFLFAPKIA